MRSEAGDWSDRNGSKTHLARVDLLTAEGIVVGTHFGGVGARPCVLVLVVGCRRPWALGI